MKLIFLFAEDLGIDEQTFLDYFHSDKAKKETQNTFQKAVQFAQSFPTMLVENNGEYTVIENKVMPLFLIWKNVLKH